MTAGTAGHTGAYYRSQDGLALYYRDYPPASRARPGKGGQRPALLCLAGLSRNSRDFHEPATRFAARGFRVICPDYRGRGQSARDPRPANYTPPVYLEDIRHLLTLLDLHRVIVIGTSLGGLLAMGMGAAMPAVLAGVVLNDIGPVISAQGLAHIRDYLSGRPVCASWQAAAGHIRNTAPSGVDRSDAFWLAQARAVFRETAPGRIEYDWDAGLLRTLGTGPVPEIWPLFRGLRGIPLLALRGAYSNLLTPETFSRMAVEIPAMTCVTIPDAGHPPTLTEPEAVAALDGFLEHFDD